MSTIHLPREAPELGTHRVYTATQAARLVGSCPQYINHVIRRLLMHDGLPSDLIEDVYEPTEVKVDDCVMSFPGRTQGGYIKKRVKGFTLYSIWFIWVCRLLLSGDVNNPYGSNLTYDSLAKLIRDNPDEFSHRAFVNQYPEYSTHLSDNHSVEVGDLPEFRVAALLT